MSTNTIIFLVVLIVLCAYPYYAWWAYQRQCIDFRLKLVPGSRVKFLVNKEPRYGRVTKIFRDNFLSVKDQETGRLFYTSKNNIFPRLGKENKNPIKSTK